MKPASSSPEARDPRLDPYRDQVADVEGPDGSLGTFYMATQSIWWRTGGHLWWKRWSDPSEAVVGFLLLGDRLDEFYLTTDEQLDDLVEELATGTLMFRGSKYSLRWIAAEDAERIRVERFGA